MGKMWYYFIKKKILQKEKKIFRKYFFFLDIQNHLCVNWGSSWPWSYGSWIYNYLCHRCLSPL